MEAEAFALQRRVQALEQDLGLMAANGLDGLRLQRALSMVSFNCNPVTVDPASPRDGTSWYRSDLNAFRFRINGVTYSMVSGTFNTVATDVIFDAKGDLAVGTGADTAAALTVGADDTILMADSGTATGLKWVASASPSAVGTAAATGTADTFTRGDHVHAHEAAHIAHDTLWDAKGDLAGGTGADTAAKLTVGANTTLLMADSTQTTGMKWQATPAARYIPLLLTAADDARTGVRVVTAYDAHGSFATYGPHVDNIDADANFKGLRWSGIHVPADFSSGMTLKFLFSSSVASNNAVFTCGARETLTGATGHTTSLNEGGNGVLVLACPGTANTLATGSIAFDVAPTVGCSLQVGISINTAHASDSNTGTKTLWDAWLEYTPTL